MKKDLTATTERFAKDVFSIVAFKKEEFNNELKFATETFNALCKQMNENDITLTTQVTVVETMLIFHIEFRFKDYSLFCITYSVTKKYITDLKSDMYYNSLSDLMSDLVVREIIAMKLINLGE